MACITAPPWMRSLSIMTQIIRRFPHLSVPLHHSKWLHLVVANVTFLLHRTVWSSWKFGCNTLDVLEKINWTSSPGMSVGYHLVSTTTHSDSLIGRRRLAPKAGRTSLRQADYGNQQQFYLDFGFMRASTSNFNRPNKAQDWVIHSYDGYSSYLLIVNEASCHVWAFLTKLKEPPLDIIDEFLA